MEEKVIALQEAEAILEALLFTMGRSVALKDLATVLEHDENTVRKLLHHMMDRCNDDHRGVHIIELDECFQMCTNPEYYDYLIKLTHQPKKHTLTDVMLETLSIIAYKQPVTRSMIEQIRGVNCDHVIHRLIEFNLVCEVGRLDAPGKPILFGTTEEFLRTFGVKSQEELPIIDPVKVEEFKTEAEEEIKIET